MTTHQALLITIIVNALLAGWLSSLVYFHWTAFARGGEPHDSPFSPSRFWGLHPWEEAGVARPNGLV